LLRPEIDTSPRCQLRGLGRWPAMRSAP